MTQNSPFGSGFFGAQPSTNQGNPAGSPFGGQQSAPAQNTPPWGQRPVQNTAPVQGAPKAPVSQPTPNQGSPLKFGAKAPPATVSEGNGNGGGDYLIFDPVPQELLAEEPVAVLAAYNYIEEHKTVYQGVEKVGPAVEFLYAVVGQDGKAYFVKDWPMSYSLFEKAKYAHLYYYATGRMPEAGSTPDDIIGLPVMARFENVTKTSAKGKEYTYTKLAKNSLGRIHKSMLAYAPSMSVIGPQLQEALSNQG